MTPQLDGLVLQWTRLLDPYVLNYVEYRLVANLSLSYASQDSSAFVTLPFTFTNAQTRQLKIPNSFFVPGSYYEFRLSFPYDSYVYYTNTIISKVFSANSSLVSNVQTSSTNSSVFVAWSLPEYTDNIVGYQLRLISPSSNTLTDLSLPSQVTSFTFDCLTSGCLSPETTYSIGIAVIRGQQRDSFLFLKVTTKATPALQTKTESAELDIFRHSLHVSFLFAPVAYSSPTPVSSSFLSPAALVSQRQDTNVSLSTSLVQTVSDTDVVVSLSSDEYSALMSQIASSLALSPLSLRYGVGHVIRIKYHCMLYFGSLNCVSLIIGLYRPEHFSLV